MHPFAAAGKRMSRRNAKYPCQRHERNEQRAVGNTGSYAVRHRRAEHGSGSGSYRRVPEPVIARHPRGAWERQRGETYTRFDAEPFCTVVGIGQGKSKNRWFLAAFLRPFAAEGKRMSRRSAKYSRRRQTCRTRVQPAIEERKTGRRDASPCGVRDRSRENRPAPEARNTSFPSYHKSTKDCNARSAFPAAGHCI